MRSFQRLVAAVVVTACALTGAVTGAASPAWADAPAKPTLVSPTYDQQDVDGNPVLKWTAVASAAKYRVQVSSSESFSPLLFEVDTFGLQATPTGELPPGQLYWRVAGLDSGGNVGAFADSKFRKLPVQGPTLVSPPDDAELAYPGTAPVLKWNAMAGMKGYRVELDDADDFIGATVVTTANRSLALTEPLILNKDYFWRVQGISATNGVTTLPSDAWSFRTTWPVPDGQPTLLEPADDPNVEVTDVVFRWSPVTGAKNYQIQVSPNRDFANNLTEDTQVKGTQYSPPNSYNNATYYWRVRALDTGGSQHQGPWSEKWQFKRAWTQKPVLQRPIDGSHSAEPRFVWDGIKHASHYEFQISTDRNFTTLTASCTTFNTSFSPHDWRREIPNHPTNWPPDPASPWSLTCDFGLWAGGHYYWRVRGLDMPVGINGVFSEAQDFFYTPGESETATGVPVLTGPADNAVGVPVLTWERVLGYSKYRVKITEPNGDVHTVDTYGTSYRPSWDLTAGAYSWFVVGVDAYDAEGNAPGAPDVRHFVVPADAPAEETSGDLDPIVAAEGGDPTAVPTLSWRKVEGAKYYNVFVAPEGSPSYTMLNEDYLKDTIFTYTKEPKDPSAYTWYVNAYNENKGFLQQSSLGTFTVADLDYATYVSPANCAIDDCAGTPWPSTPEMRWNPVPAASFYYVWVALDRDFTNVVRAYRTQNTSFTPRESYLDNAAGQSYFWFVQPCKTRFRCGPFQGPSLAEHEQAFRKKSPPVQLNELEPKLTDSVSLGWEDYAAEAQNRSGAKLYRVQVATDSLFNNIVDDATVDQPSYEAWQKSYPDDVYYWRVQAIDGGGAPLTYSDTGTFRKSAGVPEVTSLDPQTTGLPTLTWDALPYVSGYAVEIFRGGNPAFPAANRVLSTTTKLAAFTPNDALPADLYSWRVRKLDADGNSGPWSDGVHTFTVGQPAPALVAPDQDAPLDSNDMLFEWQQQPGAASYLFESSSTANFERTVERSTTVMTSWAPTASYADGVTYHWRIKVLDGSGNVMGTSAARRFFKDAAGPKVTEVSPTTGLAVDGTVTVTFDEPVAHVSAQGLALSIAGTNNGVAGTVAPVPGTPTKATFRPVAPLVPGQRYNLVVGKGITDTVGNTMTPGTTEIRVAGEIQNDSPALVKRWDSDPHALASGGAYLSARAKGATATVSFTGTSVSILGRASSLGGLAEVTIDGVKQPTVSFYSAKPVFKKKVFSKTGLSAGAHSLTVRVLGTKGTAKGSTYVELDAFVAGVTIQENAAAVRTGFARVSASGSYGGTYESTNQESDTTGAEYRFSFRGTGFSWIAAKTPGGGAAVVYVDGAKHGTVNQYVPAPWYGVEVFRVNNLTDGVHNVRLVLTGRVPESATGEVTVDQISTY